MEGSSLLQDLTGIKGRWSIVFMLLIIVAVTIMFLGCVGSVDEGERLDHEHEMFEQCIAAGRVWVDGNCLPASEVQG